jgi:hypothetical protein
MFSDPIVLLVRGSILPGPEITPFSFPLRSQNHDPHDHVVETSRR